jgi:hypothetical protein
MKSSAVWILLANLVAGPTTAWCDPPPYLLAAIAAKLKEPSFPELEGTYLGLRLGLDASLAERLTGKPYRSSRVDNLLQVGHSAASFPYLRAPVSWPKPLVKRLRRNSYFLPSGNIQVHLYFDRQDRLVWKEVDLVFPLGSPLKAFSEDEIRTLLRWAFQLQDQTPQWSEDASLAHSVLAYFTMEDGPACFDARTQKEFAQTLRDWAQGVRNETYHQLIKPFAKKLVDGFSIDSFDSNAPWRATYLYRLTEVGAGFAWNSRPPENRQKIHAFMSAFTADSFSVK